MSSPFITKRCIRLANHSSFERISLDNYLLHNAFIQIRVIHKLQRLIFQNVITFPWLTEDVIYGCSIILIEKLKLRQI